MLILEFELNLLCLHVIKGEFSAQQVVPHSCIHVSNAYAVFSSITAHRINISALFSTVKEALDCRENLMLGAEYWYKRSYGGTQQNGHQIRNSILRAKYVIAEWNLWLVTNARKFTCKCTMDVHLHTITLYIKLPETGTIGWSTFKKFILTFITNLGKYIQSFSKASNITLHICSN